MKYSPKYISRKVTQRFRKVTQSYTCTRLALREFAEPWRDLTGVMFLFYRAELLQYWFITGGPANNTIHELFRGICYQRIRK